MFWLPRKLLFLFALIIAAAPGSTAAWAGAYDFNPDNPYSGPLPTHIGAGGSPVYITNTNDQEAAATASVDSLRVGQRGSLNIGFGPGAAASAPIGLGVAGDMIVEGRVRVGTAGGGGAWLPGTATGYASGLNVGGGLAVEKGGSLLVEGGFDEGQSRVEHSGVVARRVDVNGGKVVVNAAGELHAVSTDGQAAMTIRNGGRVYVNAGLPPRDGDEMTAAESDWAFKGVGVSGGGVEVGHAGLLAAGAAGGVVDGSGAAAIAVRRNGFLDASANDMLVRSVGEVAIDGTYRSGIGSRLTSENGAIAFGERAKIVLSTDLYRRINNSGVSSGDIVARARNIAFAGGGVPVIKSGMGFYTLGLFPFGETEAEAGGDEITALSGTGSVLRVTQADRTVAGDGGAADRALFHGNLESIWNNRVDATQAEVMYDLLAAGHGSIEATGESGEFNRDALEGLMNGPGAGIPARGVADQGVFELYNGGAQWGANAVAFNTAELFMAGLDRRVLRIGAELDRLGHEAIASPTAYAACPPDSLRDGRFWAGGFFADDEADLEYGVAGYTYRPRGLMLGYDRTRGRWSLGAAAAFARGDYNDKAAEANSSRIDSYSGGLFAAYHGDDGFNASAFATASWLDNDMADQRGGMRRKADYSSYAWSLGGRLGYDMALTDRALVQPSIGLAHIRARSKSHDEFLADVHVMRVGDVRRNGTLVPVDVTIGYDLHRNFDSLLRLNAGVGYAYDLGGDAPDGSFRYAGLSGSPAVNVAKRTPGRHRFNLGLGVVYTASNVDFSARYDFTHKSSQSTHQANTQIGFKF